MLRMLLLAAVDVLLKYAMDKVVRRKLPAIFKHVDSILPFVQEQGATPAQVEQVIKDAITFETNRPVNPTDLAAVVKMYSPVEAAKTVFDIKNLTVPKEEFLPVEKVKTIDQNRLEKRKKIRELKDAIVKERAKPQAQIDHLRLARLEERVKKLKESLKDS